MSPAVTVSLMGRSSVCWLASKVTLSWLSFISALNQSRDIVYQSVSSYSLSTAIG